MCSISIYDYCACVRFMEFNVDDIMFSLSGAFVKKAHSNSTSTKEEEKEEWISEIEWNLTLIL